MVAIIDYGSGNIRSVENAFKSLGINTIVSRDWIDLQNASHIVLPGVGSFGNGMNQLKNLSLIDSLERLVFEKGVPFLGICVGHQVLSSFGSEFEKIHGLDWIEGRVEKIEIKNKELKLPHVGWNNVSLTRTSLLYDGIPEDSCFYFVHSYQFIPDDKSLITSFCEYGSKVTASVQKDNIFGVQFHPEKSQTAGLLLLENFSKIK